MNRTEQAKQDVKEMVDQIRADYGKIKDEEHQKKHARRIKNDYSHFEKHTDAQKRQFLKNLLPVKPHNTVSF